MQGIIFKDNSYKTEHKQLSMLARMLPSWVFYLKVFLTVGKISRIARLSQFNAQAMHDSSLSILDALESVGVEVEITGIENLKSLESSCVFVANHMSTLETLVLPSIIAPFKNLTFVVKEELIRYPVFKHTMKATNPITVGRKNPREDFKAVMEGGVERLKAGIAILVFPQTTRYTDLDPEKFNTIGIKLAKKASVPVIPLALKTDAWGIGKYLKDIGKIDPSKKVYFAFGEPLWIKGNGIEEHRKVIEFIQNKLTEWKK